MSTRDDWNGGLWLGHGLRLRLRLDHGQSLGHLNEGTEVIEHSDDGRLQHGNREGKNQALENDNLNLTAGNLNLVSGQSKDVADYGEDYNLIRSSSKLDLGYVKSGVTVAQNLKLVLNTSNQSSPSLISGLQSLNFKNTTNTSISRKTPGKPTRLSSSREALTNDLSDDFKIKRQRFLDSKQLSRVKIQSRFIKLTNHLVEENRFWSNQKDIFNDWQPDKPNCSICFVKFNFLIRKHHCRLCGLLVCDDSESLRKNCSILVPLNLLLEKLPNLNYSLKIIENFNTILKNSSQLFRCCVNCKNDLLHDWKFKNSYNDGNFKDIFQVYSTFSSLKHQISLLLPKYQENIDFLKLNHPNLNEDLTNKLRNKLILFLKDVEIQTHRFENKYFYKSQGILKVNDDYYQYSKILLNIYQSFVLFLQENLAEYKLLANLHQQLEKSKLELQQKNQKVEDTPRLTKKQVRELREQLMVMQEQRFLVINQIEKFTKARKFDELNTLHENKTELENMIANLESELGEFAF